MGRLHFDSLNQQELDISLIIYIFIILYFYYFVQILVNFHEFI